jgi:hypothetical protein
MLFFHVYNIPNMYILGFRLKIRPTEDAHIYNMIISAPESEIQLAMQSHQALVDLVNKTTNRKDIEIGEVIWKSDWR